MCTRTSFSINVHSQGLHGFWEEYYVVLKVMLFNLPIK